MSGRPPVPRSLAVLLIGATALLVLLGITRAAEVWRAQDVGPVDAARVQVETVAIVRRALADDLGTMDRRARTAGGLPVVHAALRRGRPDPAAFEALDGLDLPDHTSIEAVSRDGRLVAWSGVAFPRLAGPPPDSLLTRTVLDGAGRRAIALWQPVRDGDRLLGAIRVTRLTQAAVPVRNRYLQDYDLADRWQDLTLVPFGVQFTPSPRVPPAAALRGPDGTSLGRVVVPAPSPRALAAAARRPLRSLAALWATLLLAWLLGGLWLALLAALRRADAVNTRRAWLGALGALAALAAGLTVTRYGLLALDVPVRWLDAARRPAALFDPAYLATDVGAGLFRSAGDLVMTAAFGLALAGAALGAALRYAAAAARGGTRGPIRRLAGLGLAALVAPAATIAVAIVARRAVLDATLDYVDRTGSVADPLSLAALGGLAALAGAAVAAVASTVLLAWVGVDAREQRGIGVAAAALAVAGAAAGAVAVGVPVGPVAALAALGGALALVLAGRAERWVWPLTFRGMLAGALLLAPVLYGLVREPLRERTDATLADAAETFADSRDRRVSFAVEQVLAEARADDALRPALLDALAYADSVRQAGGAVASDSTRPTVDDLVAGLVTSSLLGSLVDVAAELQLVSPAGDTLGRFADNTSEALASPAGALAYGAMKADFEAGAGQGFQLRTAPVAGRRGLSRTAALGPIVGADGEPAAWLYVRATPRQARFATETPFPRVLAPAGLFGLDDEALAYAEYDDGALVRNRGTAPLRLDSVLVARLGAAPEGVYLTDSTGGSPSRAYAVPVAGDAQRVVVVRAPANERVDVLFVMLRLSLAGLAAGALVFLVGLSIRRRLGLLPAPRIHFRDKVLNRFLAVGLVSVAMTGVIGQRVIEEQNQQAVRETLVQRLGRAEAALATPAAPGASASARLDGVAAALGVDVHLYEGADLEGSSRRQLVNQRLIEPRLPGDVYRALYLDGEPYAFGEDRIGYGSGAFTYTTGYKALPDSTGRPVAAVAVPTLSDQAAIEVGQARMVAYLFGGLLLLLVAIAVFAVLLAGQLTRPFARLREGLEAVGSGAAEKPIPVETRDEVGELVETFNAMQAALAESRRQLAVQERELAWSEMARQVAHEIKNPLMPMKLSVQHLLRTHRPPADDATTGERDFAARFERTSHMLIDQIDTLTRIASDFSTFARMPNRAPESLDLNEVAREAAALFEGPLADNDRTTLDIALAAEPLPVQADHEEVRRVLVNLLTNALQAIPSGAPGHITLASRLEEGHAVLSVTDNGVGIASDVRSKVFQPSFSTKTSGMGLGLAISKRAVEAAGGTIAFDTADGAGTTFTVRLPLNPGDA